MFTNDPIKFNKETNKDKALLCLDPGTKNIGIAISDINKKVATPIEVIKFTKYMDLKN
ncbi:MAG: Holliday junction resolvase RuvX, partial [Pseudomonadota bacterium]|nr:Holliday junction resolvase RuvX [Pseudomonadota bacterium]